MQGGTNGREVNVLELRHSLHESAKTLIVSTDTHCVCTHYFIPRHGVASLDAI